MDLGTNSFHLLVADVDPEGHLDPLVREKEMLRLGDVVSHYGHIPETAADQVVATVRRFRLLAEAAGAMELHAKATSAIRRAENGGALADRIRGETGVSVDVIGGLEEARLIFGAIRSSVLLHPAPALCFDLGGGSLEVMVGDAGSMHWATSVPLGVARLTAELVRSDPPTKGERRALRDHIAEVLAPVAAEVVTFEPKLVVGSSGTLESIATMVAARRPEQSPTSMNQLRFTRKEFLSLHEEIVQSNAAQRLRIPGMDARRVDLIVAGSTVLATAMELFEFDELIVSEWALREGIVLDAVRHHEPADWSDDPHAIRRASVLGLARRCNWQAMHARAVAAHALALFDLTAPLHGLDATDRELLEDAALLHDIGEHVASSAHHKHGAYIIRNGQLRGFSPDEVELLAAIVRWHRRGEPRVTDEFPLLDAAAIERVRVMTALLRVADGLDRGRSQSVQGITGTVNPTLVLVRLETDGDPELEVWGARRKRELFEKVFDRELEFSTHPSLGFAGSRWN